LKPSLVVLAAGLARRFGRLKQLESVGPGGETLLDFGIFDAVRGGFGKIVLVIRRDTTDAFRDHAMRFWPQLSLTFALQEPETGGAPASPARSKPWGTAQAVLAAEPFIKGPFAVMNADDFYGARTIALMAAHLRGAKVHSEFFLAGYPIESTLSRRGGVSRAVSETDHAGRLLRVTEYTDVHRENGRIMGERNGHIEAIPPESLVSMNLWGFTPLVFRLIQEGFRAFLQKFAGDATAEYTLPDAVAAILASHAARVRVLPSQDEWMGITYAQDKNDIEQHIRDLIASGAYPQGLALPLRPE
jgi:hypothetical protein